MRKITEIKNKHNYNYYIVDIDEINRVKFSNFNTVYRAKGN